MLQVHHWKLNSVRSEMPSVYYNMTSSFKLTEKQTSKEKETNKPNSNSLSHRMKLSYILN